MAKRRRAPKAAPEPPADLVRISDIITVDQAAELLGVTDRQVWVYCRAGLLGRSSAIGYIVTRADVAAFERPKPGRPPRQR